MGIIKLKMKYATLAALMGLIAAKPTCQPEGITTTIYKDAECKHVHKKLNKKYGGHVKEEQFNLYSGKCEGGSYQGEEYSLKMKCSADGLVQKAWEGNKKCKGEPQVYDMPWGKCFHAKKFDVWAIIETTQEWEALAAPETPVEKAAVEMFANPGYEAWKQTFCVDLFEHYGFQGKTHKVCLGPHNPANWMDVNTADFQFNDLLSSMKVGANVKATFYQHHLSQAGAWRQTYNGPYAGKIGLNDQVSMMRIFAKNKAACVFEHYGAKGNQECFTYNENTGNAVFSLIPRNFNDCASSVTIPAGVQVQLWEHNENQGRSSKFFGPDKIDLPHNDCYSTIKVCR